MTEPEHQDVGGALTTKYPIRPSMGLAPLCAGLMAATVAACATKDGDEAAVEAFDHVYASSAVVFNDEGNVTYVSLLPDLERTELDLDDAIEYPGWSGIAANGGKLFISDGEAPEITRYRVDKAGAFTREAAMSFLNYGAEYGDSAFVSPEKAYVFAEQGVAWDPGKMEVTGAFDLPEVEDLDDDLTYKGLAAGRSFVARGDRAYVATNWANWDTYTVAEDSLIVVIDTESDRVLKTIPAPCPYLDVATIDDDGYVYFSNWTYSLSQTLIQGKRQACALRIAPGEDELDDSWSLTFADVTEGREGAALRYLGDNKALFVAYHDERVEGELTDYGEEYPGELADLSNWRVWMLDLETMDAAPIDGLDWSAGGYYMSRVGGDRNFVLAPKDDYTETSFYEVFMDGTAKLRFVGPGWSLSLVQVR